MLIYVAGPYSADTPEQVQANIKQAADIAKRLWAMGHAVICPHLNTIGFEASEGIDYDMVLKGDFKMIQRCDAVVFTPDWQISNGAQHEYAYAVDQDIPVYMYPSVPSVHSVETNSPVQCSAFMQTLMSMYRIHLDKNADYSPANILGTGQVGVVVRLWDKMARLMNLMGFKLKVETSEYDEPIDPKNESVDDTLLDAANYAIICRLLRAKKWGR
jgi:nucleoside 2-deoxyribosyltransferase